jgi:hypothetical protein
MSLIISYSVLQVDIILKVNIYVKSRRGVC